MQTVQKKLTFTKSLLFAQQIFIIFTFFLPKVSMALLIQGLPTNNNLDADLSARQNPLLLNQSNIRYRYQAVFSHGQEYRLGQFINSTIPNTSVQYVVLHDSEDGAFDSGLQSVADNGGRLLVLENNEHRNLYDFAEHQMSQFDPNRIFWGLNAQTAKTISLPSRPDMNEDNQVIKDNPNAEFANYLLKQLGVLPNLVQKSTNQSLLIALHNNHPNGAFGVDNIGKFGNTQVACQHDSEDKNLYWLAHTEDKTATQNLVTKLCALPSNVNVVTETAPSIADGDGSLSIYMANANSTASANWQYVNIEVKAGIKGDSEDEQRAKNEQIRYIENLQLLIHSQYPPPTPP